MSSATVVPEICSMRSSVPENAEPSDGSPPAAVFRHSRSAAVPCADAPGCAAHGRRQQRAAVLLW